MHAKIVINAMVRMDSSFNENRKRYDLFSFVDRFGTFWIPAAAGVIFFIFEDVLNKSYNCFRIIIFPVCKNRD
jgi:hypothetical protein